LRVHKSQAELARLAAAAAVADGALATVEAGLAGASGCADLPTEAGLALALDTEMRRLGADAPAFATIVASGPSGAEPHHRPGDRRLAPGDLVVVDFGAVVEGYCSDMTRVLVVGGPDGVPAELRRAAAVVLAAQDAGLSAVGDGVPAAEVDRACREVVEAAGLGDLFVHGTGHGVGLDIHEAPSVARTSADILSCGQVVTVEPGVYIPGLGGVRTEDTVVVTEAGCQILTLTPKQAQASL
jgi:Xaa-Pro aminopeptidase